MRWAWAAVMLAPTMTRTVAIVHSLRPRTIAMHLSLDLIRPNSPARGGAPRLAYKTASVACHGAFGAEPPAAARGDDTTRSAAAGVRANTKKLKGHKGTRRQPATEKCWGKIQCCP